MKPSNQRGRRDKNRENGEVAHIWEPLLDVRTAICMCPVVAVALVFGVGGQKKAATLCLQVTGVSEHLWLAIPIEFAHWSPACIRSPGHRGAALRRKQYSLLNVSGIILDSHLSLGSLTVLGFKISAKLSYILFGSRLEKDLDDMRGSGFSAAAG